jgi:hypothetical protein
LKIYIAGRYTHTTEEERRQYVEAGKLAILQLMKKGHTPICTFSMTDGLEHNNMGLHYDDFMNLSLEWLLNCQAVYMLEGWEQSNGARIERELAEKEGLPIYENIELIPEGDDD